LSHSGALAWARLLYIPRVALPLLLGELVILLAILGAWLAVDGHPDGVLNLVLLALASVAMGGQSTWALHIHQTTTYFTGLVTKAAGAVADGSTNRLRTGIRQLAALLAGAVVSGVVLFELRLAAPAVPAVLLAAAIAVHLLRDQQPSQYPSRGVRFRWAGRPSGWWLRGDPGGWSR
jgi:uncharacterized membrane protein YoaK (UPF0700 family)